MNKFSLSYSLSDTDIKRMLRGHCKVVSNVDMYKYGTLDELLSPSGCVVVLYETEPNVGHWVSVIKRSPTLVEFFDPYGTRPDDELREIDPRFRHQSHQDYPYLKRLLFESGYDIEFNQYPIQKLGGSTATCGRHSVVRILSKDLPLNDYIKELKSGFYGRTPDEAVANLTNELF